jgi:hypothetical protein
MSSYRSIRVDRATAERLLAGQRVPPDAAAVATLLRTATAPTHLAELAGEGTVVTAFRYAAMESTRRPTLRTAVAKILTVKAAVVLAVVGSAGAVVAATGGALPSPWTRTPASRPETTRPATPPPATTESADAGKPAEPGAGKPAEPTEPGAPQEPSKPCQPHCADAPPDKQGEQPKSTHEDKPNPRSEQSTRPETPDSQAQGAEHPAGADAPSPGG